MSPLCCGWIRSGLAWGFWSLQWQKMHGCWDGHYCFGCSVELGGSSGGVRLAVRRVVYWFLASSARASNRVAQFGSGAWRLRSGRLVLRALCIVGAWMPVGWDSVFWYRSLEEMIEKKLQIQFSLSHFFLLTVGSDWWSFEVGLSLGCGLAWSGFPWNRGAGGARCYWRGLPWGGFSGGLMVTWARWDLQIQGWFSKSARSGLFVMAKAVKVRLVTS